MTTSAVAAVASSIVALTSLVPALPQVVTNGASVLGTLSASNLSVTGVDGIVSWGANTVSNYNPYNTDFNSGKYYHISGQLPWLLTVSQAARVPHTISILPVALYLPTE